MRLFRKYRDGGEELVDALVQAGIDTVYSIPGAQLLSVWDAIGRRNDIQLIVPRSEWQGVELAIKYFQKHGKPAVVMNTVGPGVVNELPALFMAQLHKATVICISPAQPEYKRRRIDRVFQGLRDEEILGPWAGQIPMHLHTLNAIQQVALKVRRGAASGSRALRIQFRLLF
jgi:thiamine pyrophosphate-dependent acetolactate synthase large subunit-like protein